MSLIVLVIDDEEDVETLFRQQFRKELRTGEFAMDFATGAADALDVINASDDETLILILSDINMPGMSGLDLLPKVRALRPDVPVIMITAYGDRETRNRVLESGAQGLYTKPIDFAALRQEIRDRVEQAA